MLGRRKHLAVVSLTCTVILLMVVMTGYKNPGAPLLQLQPGKELRAESTEKSDVIPHSSALAREEIKISDKSLVYKPQKIVEANLEMASSLPNSKAYSPPFRNNETIRPSEVEISKNKIKNSSVSSSKKYDRKYDQREDGASINSDKFELTISDVEKPINEAVISPVSKVESPTNKAEVSPIIQNVHKKEIVTSSANKNSPQFNLKTPKVASTKVQKKVVTDPNAMINARFYPQILKAAVSGAKHRVAMEYGNFPEEISFKPGFTVPRTATKKILILTTWRSGSTFLGDIFNAYPGTFYSFEPLHMVLKKKHLQEGPEKPVVLELLKDIMNCNMTGHTDFFEYAKDLDFLFSHNSRYWKSCSINRALCFDPLFFNQICEIMPVNVMKTVRMGAKPVAELMADPTLDLRVIHLVRDPRGTMQSRKKLAWCAAPVCSDPMNVCESLVEDLAMAEDMQNKYPDRYLLVRYEDLSTRPHEMVNMLLDYVDLTYTEQMKKFVTEHTKVIPIKKTGSQKTNALLVRKNIRKHTNTYSTFRDSKSTVFKWRNSMKYSDMAAIQNVCKDALNILNFRVFNSEEEYKNDELSVFLED